jgi:hypothetical protein
MLTTPILFLTFNRPDTTKLVFDEIRKARPNRLYVCSDGPRDDHATDRSLIDNVRGIVTDIDWECECEFFFRDKNVGSKICSSEAISWFFSKETEGIILEDDCLPDQSFFYYCKELLEKYRSDSRVWTISGDYFQSGRQVNRYSYYYSKYFHCWGWATWRRVWQNWDDAMDLWPEAKENLLVGISDGNEAFIKYWSNLFERLYRKEIDHWDYKFMYTIWLQGGLNIVPCKNLVSNIGFGTNATNTTIHDYPLANLPRHQIELPLKHPPYMLKDIEADRFADRNVFQIGNDDSAISSDQNDWFIGLLKRLTGMVGLR